jgi:hypothetical protein
MVSNKLSKSGSSLLLVLTGALLSLSLFPQAASAQAQSDNTSVADAARRAREQKKNAPKPARTLTNDDLPAAPPAGQPSLAPPGGAESAAPDQANTDSETATPGKAPAAAETAAPAGDAQKKKEEIEATLKRAKAELAQALSELDILQRKSALDSDSFYSQTGFSQDTEGKAKLDEDAHQVNDKKSQVDELKSKVAALQAELGEAAEPDKPAQPQ